MLKRTVLTTLAGAAAAVTMHAWIRRHVFGQRIGE